MNLRNSVDELIWGRAFGSFFFAQALRRLSGLFLVAPLLSVRDFAKPPPVVDFYQALDLKPEVELPC